MFEMPSASGRHKNHLRRWADALLLDLGSISKRKKRTSSGVLINVSEDRLESVLNGVGSPPAQWEREIITEYISTFPGHPPGIEEADVFPSEAEYEAFERLNTKRLERARERGYHPSPNPNLEQLLVMVKQAKEQAAKEETNNG
jgi:hypothetical protein